MSWGKWNQLLSSPKVSNSVSASSPFCADQNQKRYLRQTLFHLFLLSVQQGQEAQRQQRVGSRLLRLHSYSKWESLNRAPMNITTSLDLKSPGIFVGIACALQEETPPCRLYCCFHSLHRSVHVPTRTSPCQVTSSYCVCVFFWFLWTGAIQVIMAAAASIIILSLNQSWQATVVS